MDEISREGVSWRRWDLDKVGESWREREVDLERGGQEQMKNERRQGGWATEKEREG